MYIKRLINTAELDEISIETFSAKVLYLYIIEAGEVRKGLLAPGSVLPSRLSAEDFAYRVAAPHLLARMRTIPTKPFAADPWSSSCRLKY